MPKRNDFVIRMDERSEGFDSFKYPGGELQVRLHKETIESLKESDSVVIIANIYNSDDIMRLLLLQDAIDSVAKHITPDYKATVIPYLPYSRADRRFVEGDCLGKSVFLTMIRSVWPNSVVYTIDCHSSAFGKDYVDIPIDDLLKSSIILLADSPINILFPDLGAKNRYGNIFDGMTDINIFFCEKKRDPESGKFLGFKVPEGIDKSLDTIIIDDICDGGGTFIGIANELQMSRERLTLYVTHGIFSKGFDELSKWFGNIITTDTFTKDDIVVPGNMNLTVHEMSY